MCLTAWPVRGPVAPRSAATDEIVESLKGLTLLEASELVSQIEETFGVDASASGGMMVAAPGAEGAGGDDAAEKKTDFDVVITEVDASKKIACIKAVRALTTLGLKDAKDAVTTGLPFTILEAQPKSVCDDAVKQLEEAGAKCELN